MANKDPQTLGDIDNIKIPYPTEGVIRTAQLDDTISPPNSADLAVNMNFDRVGAIMTRPGVMQYANNLGGAISNFGTLHNEIVPAGYNNLTQLGTVEDLLTSMKFPAVVKSSSTVAALFWTDSSNLGHAQLLTINETNGDITPQGNSISIGGANNANNTAIYVSSNLVLNVWTDASNHGLAQAFDTSGTSIVADSSPLTFDSNLADWFSITPIDTNGDFLLCYSSTVSGNGVAIVLNVNLSTGAVTQLGSPLTFHSGPVTDISVAALGDGTHFVVAWNGTTGGLAQTLAVNTSTWAITAIGTALTIDTTAQQTTLISVGDGQHFVEFWRGSTSDRLEAQTLSVNLSTFAVTKVGTSVFVSSGSGNDAIAVGFGDGQHFLALYTAVLGTGYVQMVQMNPSTFNLSLVGELLTNYDFANDGYTAVADLTSNVVLAVWGNVNALDGKAVMFEAYGTVVENRWLYAAQGSSVYNTSESSAGVWTAQATGLATVSKPRFAQYLGYIWMVNGNQQIGGNPVMTSNGGAFGTTMVPQNFPSGDYIHAGFEGRVWVADSTLGVIYYTDIVQFTPPNVYTLTYNQDIDYIATISPQTGETITGFCEVPRALLVFTQNTITRIYGAASIDAYPAYNVGTYSQESIVTNVKNGIYFHHSSGFYQFTPNVYAAQPTEISRRIIDFIKAIPRANYGNITGVYDGFDNIEWSIGTVTVDGVTYQNCVCRFTISTQVWTIYDYVLGSSNGITAMIFYDDGSNLNHLMGTQQGQTGQMDVGVEDFNNPFYYEFIDRWRSYTEMYYQTQRIDAVSVYHKNAAGANITYQGDNAATNEWKPLGAITPDIQSLVPNGNSEDFTVNRIRIAGTTKGVPIIIHGIEIPQVTQKGQAHN